MNEQDEVLWAQSLESDELGLLESTTTQKAQFVSAYKSSALATEASMRVPALVTLGQAALESGWGAHAPKFNFFGIKAKVFDPPERRQLVQTREVLSVPDHPFPEVISVTQRPDGKYLYVIRDWFRSFVSAEEAFKAHAELLSGNQRYARAFTMGLDAFAFAMEVARAGYATDPSYETTLAAIMRSVQSAGFP